MWRAERLPDRQVLAPSVDELKTQIAEVEAQCKALRGPVVKADETRLAERSGAPFYPASAAKRARREGPC